MASDPIHEGILLDDSVVYTVTEFCQIYATQESIILEMIEYGVLEPKGISPATWLISQAALPKVQKALRLQKDLAINWAGISVILDLLDEVTELRQQLTLPYTKR